MNFKKWVKSIQTAGYNGARTVVLITDWHFCRKWGKNGKLETFYKIYLYIKVLRVKIGHHKIGAWAEIRQNRIWGGWGVKTQKTSDIINGCSLRVFFMFEVIVILVMVTIKMYDLEKCKCA